MKIDLSAPLSDFNGNPLRATLAAGAALQLLDTYLPKLPAADQEAAIAQLSALRKPMTLRDAVVDAAGAGLQNLSAEEIVNVFAIVASWPKAGEVDLESEDVALLKKALGKHFISPLVLGQCWRLMEGKAGLQPA